MISKNLDKIMNKARIKWNNQSIMNNNNNNKLNWSFTTKLVIAQKSKSPKIVGNLPLHWRDKN